MDFPPIQKLYQCPRSIFREPNLDPRQDPTEVLEQLWKKPLESLWRRADSQHARGSPPQCACTLLDRFGIVQNGTRIVEQLFPGSGQLQVAAYILEQRDSK